jgi:predicted nucleic acid-binding protein
VKIVLDTTILVRANEHSHGLARELLITVVDSKHTLLLSNEMLHELARVLVSRDWRHSTICRKPSFITTSLSYFVLRKL